jgi:hypothetical protein
MSIRKALTENTKARAALASAVDAFTAAICVACVGDRTNPDGGPCAEEKLRHWQGGSRDDAVREAAAARVSIARIQEITGLATTTIQRILNKPPKPRP